MKTITNRFAQLMVVALAFLVFGTGCAGIRKALDVPSNAELAVVSKVAESAKGAADGHDVWLKAWSTKLEALPEQVKTATTAAESVTKVADEAKGIATTAKSTADAANTAASNAVTKANEAEAKAATAVSIANDAKTTASTAHGFAMKANSTAESASATSNAAKATIGNVASAVGLKVNEIARAIDVLRAAQTRQVRLVNELNHTCVQLEACDKSRVVIRGFTSGKADLDEALKKFPQDAEAAEALQKLVAEQKKQIRFVVGSEDLTKCKDENDADCNNVAYSRAEAVAKKFDFDTGLIKALPKTDRWDASLAGNRLVVIYYEDASQPQLLQQSQSGGGATQGAGANVTPKKP